ncbi:MAG: hypothetical protein CM15mP125_3560 [Gammaproteobacteria bacterium]|nr:MAG: hypothetical protein CM15mP125_3560 [Gammaproteobacteria bacterium]
MIVVMDEDASSAPGPTLNYGGGRAVPNLYQRVFAAS